MNSGASVRKAACYPTHVAVFLDRPEAGPEWQSWLTFELSLRGFLLDTDGEIHSLDGRGAVEENELLGFFRFLDVEETLTTLRNAQVEVSALSNPWNGSIRGAIGWEHCSSAKIQDGFLPVLLRKTWGPVTRTADLSSYEVVRQVSFGLHNLMSKYGFGDRGVSLSRTPEYMEYATEVAQQALAAADLDAYVGVSNNTHHNPLRIWGSIRRSHNGKEVGEGVLDGLSMVLWAYDDTCLNDTYFW